MLGRGMGRHRLDPGSASAASLGVRESPMC